MKIIPLLVCLVFLTLAEPARLAFAGDVLMELNRFEISQIEIDIQYLYAEIGKRESYLAQLFKANNKQITGKRDDLLTFADLYAGVPLDRQQEVMKAIIPLPSRRFIEIMGEGRGRELFSRCPVDARGFVDCQ